MPFDLRASSFNQFSVIHSRRASRHASHAAEAGIEMADPLRIHRSVAFAGKLHQVDSAARRVHFLVPEHVSRANRQAEAAMHAILDNLFRRRMMRVKRAEQWICVRKSSHEIASLAATREHNRTTAPQANLNRNFCMLVFPTLRSSAYSVPLRYPFSFFALLSLPLISPRQSFRRWQSGLAQLLDIFQNSC
jgi:hypothetical protein